MTFHEWIEKYNSNSGHIDFGFNDLQEAFHAGYAQGQKDLMDKWPCEEVIRDYLQWSPEFEGNFIPAGYYKVIEWLKSRMGDK